MSEQLSIREILAIIFIIVWYIGFLFILRGSHER